METAVDAPARGAVPTDTFAARLMLVRLHGGNLTATQAAERCGLTRENWINWEHGGNPRDFPATVEAISEGLGIDRDWLSWGGPLAQPERRGPRTVARRRTLNKTYATPPVRPTGPRSQRVLLAPGHTGGRHPTGRPASAMSGAEQAELRRPAITRHTHSGSST
jgi:transcriptional regulator with XRE-family HTH domain